MSEQKVKIKVDRTVPSIFPVLSPEFFFFTATVLFVRNCGNFFVYDQSSPLVIDSTIAIGKRLVIRNEKASAPPDKGLQKRLC